MGDNVTLRHAIAELGVSHAELAHRVNDHTQSLTGRYGTCTERTVHNWVTGKTGWPNARQRAALQAVFGCPAQELGFTPRGAQRPDAPPEDQPVRRRTFMMSGPTAAAAAAIPLLATRHTIGLSDIDRMRAGLTTLDALDDHQGGHGALERAALAGARQVLDLQQSGSASERVRRRLFALAADFTAVAAWSCIDAREPDRAAQHLDRCATLAGLAQDSTAQLRVWNSIAILANQEKRHGDAVAAGRAAQRTGITRRDPLFASLAHARTAVGLANLGDRQGALRSLGLAGDALNRAGDQPRSTWMAFYGPAELHALTAIAHDRLGDAEQTESASHRALAILPPRFRRNRALTTARLALAQLHQGDAEHATATASAVFDLMSDAPLPARIRTLLGDFYRDLLTLSATAPAAREWADRFRTEWSRS
jgi:tetratricopeptide (TPR) repeat protein